MDSETINSGSLEGLLIKTSKSSLKIKPLYPNYCKNYPEITNNNQAKLPLNKTNENNPFFFIGANLNEEFKRKRPVNTRPDSTAGFCKFSRTENHFISLKNTDEKPYVKNTKGFKKKCIEISGSTTEAYNEILHERGDKEINFNSIILMVASPSFFLAEKGYRNTIIKIMQRIKYKMKV